MRPVLKCFTWKGCAWGRKCVDRLLSLLLLPVVVELPLWHNLWHNMQQFFVLLLLTLFLWHPIILCSNATNCLFTMGKHFQCSDKFIDAVFLLIPHLGCSMVLGAICSCIHCTKMSYVEMQCRRAKRHESENSVGLLLQEGCVEILKLFTVLRLTGTITCEYPLGGPNTIQ